MNQTIVKCKKKKTTLEIVCDSRHIKQYKLLKDVKEKFKYLNKLLVVDSIFSNYKKGELAKNNEIASICKTSNTQEAILYILEYGEIQLSSAQRRKLVEHKRRGIINYLTVNFYDPVSKKPHPIVRIDNTLKSIKGFAVDPHKPIKIQVDDVLKKIKKKLNLVKNTITTTVDLTHFQLGSGMGILRKYSKIIREDYNKYGATFEIETTNNDYDKIVKYLENI